LSQGWAVDGGDDIFGEACLGATITRIGECEPGTPFRTLVTRRNGVTLGVARKEGVPVELGSKSGAKEEKTVHPDMIVQLLE
jgi:hypothetical protein